MSATTAVSTAAAEIAWSPDGAHIAVVASENYREGEATALHLVALEMGEVTIVVDGEGWLFWLNWSPDGTRLLFTMGEMRQRYETDFPYADLWLYDVASGELEQLTLGGGFGRRNVKCEA